MPARITVRAELQSLLAKSQALTDANRLMQLEAEERRRAELAQLAAKRLKVADDDTRRKDLNDPTMRNRKTAAMGGVQVELSVDPASVVEQTGQQLNYTFRRTGSIVTPLSVNFDISGTATLGVDYSVLATVTGTRGSVVIPAGLTEVTIPATVIVDGTVEGDETVIFTLAAGAGYGIKTRVGVVGTIAAQVPVVGSPPCASGIDTVQWYRNGQPVPGANDLSYVPPAGDVDAFYSTEIVCNDGVKYTQNGRDFGVPMILAWSQTTVAGGDNPCATAEIGPFPTNFSVGASPGGTYFRQSVELIGFEDSTECGPRPIYRTRFYRPGDDDISAFSITSRFGATRAIAVPDNWFAQSWWPPPPTPP